MSLKQEAYEKIRELVERFAEQIDAYKKSDYNETQTRRDFIDPFFNALGWDVDNSLGYAEAYREVIHEDRVKVGKATKAPDYSFKLPGRKRLFFVEAKKPSVFIKDDISVAYQIRRYGWSAKLPISIITDFEEFAVYDCTKKPNPTDKTGVSRIKYIHFQDYLKEFDYLWDIFSKERVLKGSFDKYIQSDAVKKGTAGVDKEFLASLDKWRTYLATSISLRNKNLSEDEINFAVQLTIDRLIFLRIAEDRGVEEYGQLKHSVTQKGDAYQNLFTDFQKADQKYNSGLFDFKKDVISNVLQIDNKVIKTIVNEMYYPESPYEFSVIPVEILGSAYEQFLGKVIRITSGHHAKIEEKPEVRKAGGVYYTPQYVVDYIVKNTIGKLIEGKSPKQISEIKICDPACGSGSFLIGAYQYLLDFYKKYYHSQYEKYTDIISDVETPRHKKNEAIRERNKLPISPSGELETNLRKEILTNHIYGVDLDTNAVEVTKLSLLLKCMEGITNESIQKLDFKERVLPSLDNNIKSGNSLIDTDFYDSELDFGEEKKIKPFNWAKEFPDVFNRNVPTDNTLPFKKQYAKVKKLQEETEKLIDSLSKEPNPHYEKLNRGFDILIGNPPYVKVSDESQINYFNRIYKHQDYQYDLYLLFLEQYNRLLVTGGLLGIIIPNTWLQSIKYRNIRKYLVSNYFWQRFLQFSSHVFKAVVDTHVLVFEKNNFIKNNAVSIDKYENNEVQEFQEIDQNSLPDDGDVINIIATSDEKALFDKIKSKSLFVNDLCTVYNGVKPFEKGKGIPAQTEKTMKEKPFVVEKSAKPEGKDWYPLLRGRLIKRYINYWNNDSWIKYGEWLAAPRKKEIFDADEKIVVRQTGDSIIATLIGKDIICRDNLHIIISNNIDLKFVLGVINSKLIDFYYTYMNPEKGEVLAQVKKAHVEQLPIPKIKPETESKYNEIINCVEQILKLNTEIQSVKLDSTKQSMQSKTSYLEDKINQIIYQIYELTKDEIKIIEGNAK